MKQIYTERQQQFVDMAAKHADSFAERADEHDRDNTFPFENYDEMRESGFLTLSIPEELGGLGALRHQGRSRSEQGLARRRRQCV